MNKGAPASPPTWTPPWPTLTALGLSTFWIAILSLPMWTGQFVGGPYSDQYPSGLAIRTWAAEQWRQTGSMPQWNPDLFGGIPVFAGFGDVFYPTAWLRLLLPTVIAMDIGFVVHYVLAAFFLYLFLRLLGVSWTGSVLGGAAYQLSGVIVSYVSPGHDGKLYVTALLPVMLIGLLLAIRRRRPEGYALLGLTTGLALLSPQYQMAQYALIVSGLFTLYLVFGDPEGPRGPARFAAMGLALAAVALGFGVAALQLVPFAQYVPFSPRANAGGYEWSTSYAIPWSHVPEFFFSGFVGNTPRQTYWGPNPLKLHSEYLGLPVIALALLGLGHPRQALTRWLAGIGVLMLLVSMGSATPFYRLWYALVPYVSKTRAPGMALYVVALVLAILAALGAERLERREGKRLMLGALIAAGVIAVLGIAGILSGIAASSAPGQVPSAAADAIRWGAVGSAIGLAVVAALGMLFVDGKLPPAALALGLPLLVGADLWRDGRSFWVWVRPEQGLLAADPAITHMKQLPQPFRVLDLDVYRQNVLHAHDIPQALGYHGNQLRTYDELWGREGDGYRFLGSAQLWKLMAVRFLALPDTVTLPGFHRVLGPVLAVTGVGAVLYEADTVPPYARVVSGALKVPAEQVVPTLLNPRLDLDRLVLLDSNETIPVAPLTAMPDPSPSRAAVKGWQPGRISVELNPPPPAPSYLLLAENWYPDWHATVDGQPVAPVRGNHTLLTVPVPAGASQVYLEFRSGGHATGRLITLFSLLVLLAWSLLPKLRNMRARQSALATTMLTVLLGVTACDNQSMGPTDVAAFDVSPLPVALYAGSTLQLTVLPLGAGSVPLTGKVLSWSSNDPTIAAVSSSGVVTGVRAGIVNLTVSCEGVYGTVPVRVFPSAGYDISILQLGWTPHGISVASNGVFYVSQMHGEMITRGVVSASAEEFTGSTKVGFWPAHVAVNPSGTMAYTADIADQTVTVVSGLNRQVTVPLSGDGYNVLVSPDGATLFASTESGNVHFISTSSNELIGTVPVGHASNGLAYHTASRTLYASSIDSGTVTAIHADTRAVIRTYRVGGKAQRLAVRADGSELFVATERAGLQVVDLASGAVTTISEVGPGAVGLALRPGENEIWTTNPPAGRIYVVDRASHTLKATLEATRPRNVAFSPDGSTAIITDEAGRVLFIR